MRVKQPVGPVCPPVQDKVQRPCLFSTHIQDPRCLLDSSASPTWAGPRLLTRRVCQSGRIWNNLFLQVRGRTGAHCRFILMNNEEEDREEGVRRVKGAPTGIGPHTGMNPDRPLPVGTHTKNEPARNEAKCGSARAESEGETAGFLQMSTHFLQTRTCTCVPCFLPAPCWPPASADLHSRAIVNMNSESSHKD